MLKISKPLHLINFNFFDMNTKFAFVLPYSNEDPGHIYKNRFFKLMQERYPQLRIIGLELDENATNGEGIQYATPGAIIEFNRERKYDVDWFANDTYAWTAAGISTELHLIDDWNEILDLVDEYVRYNYSSHYYGLGTAKKRRPYIYDNNDSNMVIKTNRGTTLEVNDTHIAITGKYDRTPTIAPLYVSSAAKKHYTKATRNATNRAIAEIVYITK